jgi:hypothetical protein
MPHAKSSIIISSSFVCVLIPSSQPSFPDWKIFGPGYNPKNGFMQTFRIKPGPFDWSQKHRHQIKEGNDRAFKQLRSLTLGLDKERKSLPH